MQSEKQISTLVGSTTSEVARKREIAKHLRDTAIPDGELLDNLGLYLTRQSLSRINFIQKLYEVIVPIHGIIMEFGVRWGQNLVLFSVLRGIQEPFNYNRRVIRFDTFSGFPSVSSEDGGLVKEGDYAVAPGWKAELETILGFHEQNAPIAHKKKFDLVEGDATRTVPQFLEDNPESIIALAYLTKGSVIAFDELNCPEFPGETVAVREVLGLSRYSIRRDPSSPLTSYVVIE